MTTLIRETSLEPGQTRDDDAAEGFYIDLLKRDHDVHDVEQVIEIDHLGTRYLRLIANVD